MDIAELKDILKEQGVVGCGGAGFPTYAKLDTRADTLIMNCAECEPLLKLHQQLLEVETSAILDAFYTVAKTLGVKDIVVGIKRSYVHTIEAVNAEIDRFPGMRVCILDKVYPTGDEVVLIYDATGRVVRPGGLPIEQGVIVMNVETCFNVSRALQGKPVTDKLVTITGAVAHPITLRLPLGMTIESAVALAGGITIPDPVCVMGGVMMGNIVPMRAVITKTTNALIILPSNHVVVQRKRQDPALALKRAAASCCQCQMCTDLCPRHALGHPIQPHLFMRAATCKDVQEPSIFLNTFFCSSCGLCEMYSCFQGLSPRSLITAYKNGLRAAGIKAPQVEAAPVNVKKRQLRKVPVDRLLWRLDLVPYHKPAPIQSGRVEADEVAIPLQMHIGAPATALVKAGDKVEAGQIIGKAGNGLSVNIHASIAGTVVAIDAKSVRIRRA